MIDLEMEKAGNVMAMRAVLERVSSKWSILILASLCSEPKRFNAIKRDLQGVTQKALTESLRRMERSGLVSRRVIPTSPIGVEYSLTPLGKSLEVPFRVLLQWSIDNHAIIKLCEMAFDEEERKRTNVATVSRHSPRP